ncbi:MAG: mechanosensitive ion channel family protein [Bacteroidetes bacterium]|nr:mechanosensitive ion channel family protein [Bacteroidota bacterium]MCW5895920.1 mechanosensitive ion channel family protein [Bacteroidota bacterium]
MDRIFQFFTSVRHALDIPIFRLGDFEVSLWTVVYMTVSIVLLVYLSGKLKNWLTNTVLRRSTLEVSVRQSVGTIIRYIVVVIGFLIIVQTAGIDLTTLNVLAGAIGIGVGFGLQNIASNFISGLIILFERPIKTGDRIEVGEVEGDVVAINARSTTVVTNDNIAIIVPNSKFVSENVINWGYVDRKIRFRIPVGVAYGSEPRHVEQLLLDVAKENPDVLDDPPPAVRFLSFGDSSLDFELRAWTSSLLHRKGKLVSDLNFSIHNKLQSAGVLIPFPQRDVHIRSVPPELTGKGKKRGAGRDGNK